MIAIIADILFILLVIQVICHLAGWWTVLTLELLRDALQTYVKRGYSWNKASNAIRIEFKDITLFINNEAEIQKQYEAKLSFRDDSKTRFNKVAAWDSIQFT